jgi:hypothetical protein
MLSPSGRDLVTLQGPGNPSWLTVQRIKGELEGGRVGTTPPRAVHSARRVLSTVGWLDRNHVVGVVWAPGLRPREQLDSINIRTGRTRTIVAVGNIPTLALGLLASPTAKAEPPPAPWNPRWVIGIFIAALGLAWWVIRVRRA